MLDATVNTNGVAPPLAAAFAPLRVLERMEEAARRQLLERIAASGLSTLLTEGVSLPPWVESEVREAGLALGAGVACFSDHAAAIAPVADQLRPVTAAGIIRPQMEWYRGIIPTDRGYVDALINACREAATQLDLNLFILDFIRWPLHWELELRDDADVIDSSFDPITLTRFRDETAIDIPIDHPAVAAQMLNSERLREWTMFKCQIITDIVERIAVEIRRVRPELTLGAFIVPGDDEQRRRYAGQDVRALAQHLDVLLPMTYHAILQRPVSWIHDVVSEIRRQAATSVTPVIQVTADPKIASGNDWGTPFGPAVFGDAIDAGLRAGGRGFVLFPAHGLSKALLAQLPARTARVTALARQMSS
jgi:hypothetical protein